MDMDKLKEKRRKAHKKWDAEHMMTLSVRLRKKHVEKFRMIAEKNGEKANTLLKNFVLNYISDNEPK